MIPHIKKILYATDLTVNSVYASYFAADLAKTHNAKIIILHCVEAISPWAYLGAAARDFPLFLLEAKEQKVQEDFAEIKKRLEEFSRKTESQFGPTCVNLVSEIIVTAGYAVEEILNAASTRGCDIIVLGTHGKGFLRQTFLGSVARSVLERSVKPVLIIPLPSDKATSSGETG